MSFQRFRAAITNMAGQETLLDPAMNQPNGTGGSSNGIPETGEHDDFEDVAMEGDDPDGLAAVVDSMTDNQEAFDMSTLDGPQDNYKVPKHSILELQTPIPFIREMRKTLFDVIHPIELKTEEFERYWPYVDNVWVRQHKAGADKTGRTSVDYYSCRLQRATYQRKPTDPTTSTDGKPPRKKRIREGGTCQARLKVTKREGLIPCLRVQRVGDHTHSHDLEAMDKLKRNSVVMDIARSEVMKGYMPASVYTVLHEDEPKLVSIGGHHINRNDVRNTSSAWRVTHKEELTTHPGYRYQIGAGILPDDAPEMEDTSQPSQHLLVPQNPVHTLPPDTLFFPPPLSHFLNPYLPSSKEPRLSTELPFVTLTYAASLDSLISLAPQIPTPISSPTTKAMTHHLRANHDAILIGVGTAIADDPKLNCRIAGAGGYGGLGWSSQPRPIIIDPGARWNIQPDSQILQAARAGRGKGPWIITAPGTKPHPDKVKLVTDHGGKYLALSAFDARYRLSWDLILHALSVENVKSVMIEGGSMVINELLRAENRHMVDAVIITLAPVFLGQGGIGVGLPRRLNDVGIPVPSLRFEDVKWQPLGEDVVLCGRIGTVEVQEWGDEEERPVLSL